jgi:hypothetical protein
MFRISAALRICRKQELQQAGSFWPSHFPFFCPASALFNHNPEFRPFQVFFIQNGTKAIFLDKQLKSQKNFFRLS